MTAPDHARNDRRRHDPAQRGGSRRLLRRLIEVMQLPIAVQERLDRITHIVAQELVAEVCSIYFLRADGYLELFATEGLIPEAVHTTRMRLDEGLIGLIASTGQTIKTAEAMQHPNFSYRPETGEEMFSSFLGVPIYRDGVVRGVITAQNRTKRIYLEDEVDALRVVATVLAEVLASGRLLDQSKYTDIDNNSALPLRLEGTALVGGIAWGPAVLRKPRVFVERFVADEPEVEWQRLRAAMAALRAAVDDIVAQPRLRDTEAREVLEAYRMIANDAGWLRRIKEAIDTGLSAEGAVRQVQQHTRARLLSVGDAYMQERLHDLNELTDRLLLNLSGNGQAHERHGLNDDEPFVLIARTLGPAELMEYSTGPLVGLVLEEGSKAAHVTILARSLGLPVLGRMAGVIEQIRTGDEVIVDGDHGQLFIRPSEDVTLAYAEAKRTRQARVAIFDSLRDLPCRTRDGIDVRLSLNAGFRIDMNHLDAVGADGIGLFRTELAFMVLDAFPSPVQQRQLYSDILDRAGARPVVFRTLDVGADKVLPYWRGRSEDNPAMGWRALRMSLDRPLLLRVQLRAMIEAAHGRNLDVMFPMVTCVSEFMQARALLDQEIARCAARGSVPETLRVGVMLEVPALYWQLPVLLPRIDFISLGTNDFCQFFFACDRANAEIADRYDLLSPAVLRFLHDLVQRCAAAKVALSVCGDMASQPLGAMALIGLGVGHLSLTASEYGPVKQMVRSTEHAALRGYLLSLLDLPAASLRPRLRDYARDHGVCLLADDATPAAVLTT